MALRILRIDRVGTLILFCNIHKALVFLPTHFVKHSSLLPQLNPSKMDILGLGRGFIHLGKDETKKTMRFWIFAGIVAIAASQIPILLKTGNQQADEQSQEQHKKKPHWMLFLFGAILLVLILWLFNYFISENA